MRTPTLGQGVRGYTFVNAEAEALVARFTTPATNLRKALIDNLVGALKAAGVWSKLVALYLLAAADAQAAQRNWISDTFNLSPVNSPSFAADLGYTGDGAASYLNWGLNTSTDGGSLFVQDSGLIGFGSRTAAGNNNADIGAGNTRIGARTVADTMNVRVNSTATVALSNTDGSGRFYGSRTLSGSIRHYRNGSPLAAEQGNASAALENATLRMLGIGGGSPQFSARQQWFGVLGAGLSAAEIAAFDAAILTYGQAVGAA